MEGIPTGVLIIFNERLEYSNDRAKEYLGCEGLDTMTNREIVNTITYILIFKRILSKYSINYQRRSTEKI